MKNSLMEIGISSFGIWIFALGVLLYGFAGLAFSFRGTYELVGVMFVLAASIFLVFKSRENVLLFILSFFIAYANYSAMAANYFATYSDWYMAYAGTDVSAKGTFVLLIFMATLLLFFPRRVENLEGLRFFNRCKGQWYTKVFAVALAALLVVISFTQSSGFSDTGGRAESNQLYEYSYVLFIIGFFFCGESKLCRYSLTAVGVLFIAQAVLGGNRASVLAIVLLLYIVFFAEKVPLKRLIPFLLLGFLAFQLVGLFRQNIDSASLSELAAAIKKLFENGLVWDTAAAAYHQSLSSINYLQFISDNEVVRLSLQWFLGIFFGGSAVPESNLPLLVQRYFGSISLGGLGGGFLPFYAYFYFDVFGVLASGLGVALLYRFISRFGESDIACMVKIALFVTVPRWWLYSPSPLTRGLLIILICSTFACFIARSSMANDLQIKGLKRSKHSEVFTKSGQEISDGISHNAKAISHY